MAAHGTFVWHELNTDDVPKAKAFYEATLGWTCSDVPMANGTSYTIASARETMTAGIVTGMAPPETPPFWLTYVEVDDVDARAASATRAGGRLMRGPYDIPGVGRIAIVLDSSGAVLGLMTSAQVA